MSLTLTPLIRIPFIRRDDNLADILIKSLSDSNIVVQDDDILVIAQKIVSKAEGRAVNLNTVSPSQRAQELALEINKDSRLVELILQESNEVLRTRPGVIIVEHRLGFVCANAGIDHSNVGSSIPDGESAEGATVGDDWVLLLPENPDGSAQTLHRQMREKTGKQIGILIIDSHGRAWRNGTVGIAIGMACLPGIEDLRGKPDLFGYTLQVTQVGVADELAAAASLVMGQAAEGTPAVHVRGFPYPLRESSLRELIRPKDQDLFR